MLILFLMMGKKPKERAVFIKKKSDSSVLGSIRPKSWNRRQLAKMIKLGGVFVSQTSA